MKLNAFLTAFGKKIGFDLTDVKLKDVLASELDIPEELVEAMEKGLMTEDAAKNNAKIKAAIRAEVYNGIDSDMEGLLEELGLGDDVAKPIKEQKKTVDKLKALASHYKTEADTARKAGNKPAEDALRKQVEELNNQIKSIKADSQKSIDQLKADNDNNLNDFSLKSLLGTRQYSLPDAMDQEEKVNMVHVILSAELKNKGFKLVRNGGALKLIKEDGSEPYDDKNNPVTLSSFADGALAQRGLLKQTDTTKTGAGNGRTTVITGNQKDVPAAVTAGMTQLDALIAEAQKAEA